MQIVLELSRNCPHTFFRQRDFHLSSNAENAPEIKNQKPKMKILNVITGTVTDSSSATCFETLHYLTRSRKLTVAGAQRILRKDNSSIIVIRVETFIDER